MFAEIFPLYEGIDPGRCGADPNGRINGRRLKGGNSMGVIFQPEPLSWEDIDGGQDERVLENQGVYKR